MAEGKGCLEHTGVVSQMIHEAKGNRGDLSIIWVDLDNADGSIPHKPMAKALSTYHVSERLKDLILDYYNSFSLRFTSRETTSAWHHLEQCHHRLHHINVLVYLGNGHTC